MNISTHNLHPRCSHPMPLPSNWSQISLVVLKLEAPKLPSWISFFVLKRSLKTPIKWQPWKHLLFQYFPEEGGRGDEKILWCKTVWWGTKDSMDNFYPFNSQNVVKQRPIPPSHATKSALFTKKSVIKWEYQPWKSRIQCSGVQLSWTWTKQIQYL